ncbi:hypothetical protein M9Y10_007666 [Tritrichomonas musculus]|uniref:Right handed beta helix domain-containing protein n=1 Tax=Tritrichomonas musculus TaxID=1915356 RepID=A0ABR2J2V4_9EUKA
MFILCFIFFKVIPPIKDQIIINNKHINAIRCGVHERENYGPQTVNDYFLIGCEDGSSMTIRKCTFTDITTKNSVFDRWSHIMLFKKSNADILECTFIRNKYTTNFISMEEPNGNNYLKFYNNYIDDCNQKAGSKTSLIKSVYKINEFKYNTIKLNEGLLQTRVFEIKYHRGCKLIGNDIQSVKYDDGSSVLLCSEPGDTSLDPIEITDCKLYNCHGSQEGSIIQIFQLDTDITIRNVTLQKTSNFHIHKEGMWSNEKYYSKGYFYQFQCKHSPAKASFIDCHFLDLESNAQSGGGIGLLFTNDNDLVLSFDHTEFERIKFTHDTYSGGAISFSSEVNQNKKTKLTVTDCSFKDVTSKNGGGAIYFNAPGKELTIERTKFINTYSNTDNSQKGGAIYVKHQEDSTPVVIKNCYFEETTSYYGGAIYIEWKAYSISPISIDGCNFTKTKANSHGYAIMITSADSNTVTISNCNFDDCVDHNDFFVLKLDVSNLNFLYNKIDFSNLETNGGCIILEKIVNHVFNGNLFKNYKFDDKDTDVGVSGGIHCFKADSLVSFSLINNTFENALGNNQGRCILLAEIPQNKVTIRNNTIINCPAGGPLFYLRFSNAISDFTIESCNFIENTVNEYWNSNADSLMTPQVWVVNKLNGQYGTKFNLIFDSCYFQKNHSPAGGAIHYGKGNNMVNTRVIFRSCQFLENEANTGSAILIESYQGCEIIDCRFIKNKAQESLGTVNIKTDFSLSESRESTLIITGSTFEDNECKEGHAIYIAESTFSVQITKCTFKDCGTKDYVISIKAKPQSVLVQNNTIHFTVGDKTATPLFLNTESFQLKENKIQNIKSTVVRFYGRNEDNDGFQIIGNTFSECSGDSVIDAENLIKFTPIIKRNTFTDISIINQLMSLKLKNSIYQVVFDNNTFCNFVINSKCGGIGLEVNHESTDISLSLSFNDCYFINNNNQESQQQGGAISCGTFQNRGNCQLTIEDCFFERNHNNGKGCAIYFNNKYAITIVNCNFTDNIGSEKGSIYIVPDESESPSSLISITKCYFGKNKVNDCSSIYIEPGSKRSIKIDSCTFDNEKGGIVLDDFKSGAEISNNHFLNIQDKSALIIKHYADSDSDSDKITIIGCTFDSCTGIDNKCFDIISNSRVFTFENNIIKNNIGTGHSNYFGTFNLNKKIANFELFNISFVNNVCNSLYGGGIGIQFLGIAQLNFNKCEFKENSAKQDNTKSRPTQNADQQYYNGDGGGIQLGYICTMNSINVLFLECTFTSNHAQRHGGAIAIQTSMLVEIERCVFENNVANYNFDGSAKLLTENHFHKKNEGRGGAIYINPSYTYDDSSLDCKSPDTAMQKVQITGCEFVKNNGFDGYGIYIEGDDINVPFSISNNNFVDNYNKNNHNDDENLIYGAVITTELTCIREEQINTDNIFTYSIPELRVRNISYVDHYGKTPSLEFTKSEAFTQSDIFPTNTYSSSIQFSSSSKFSGSNAFSNSHQFSQTKAFSKSDHFTNTMQFSKSDHFTKSDKFTKSNQFTKSDKFTKSNHFTKSDEFTKSDHFSKSYVFSETKPFSNTKDFTKTNFFSKSEVFSKTSSFTGTEPFTKSKQFSESDLFSKLQLFTPTNGFSKTKSFSNSHKFTFSDYFTKSHSFTQTNHFSNSNHFSPSIEFTLISQSDSDFTDSSFSEGIDESSNKVESSANEAEESSSDIVVESSPNEIDESSSNEDHELSSSIVIESSSNKIDESSDIIVESSSNEDHELSYSIVIESSSNKIDESSTNEIEKSSSDIIDETSSNGVVESTSNEITYSSTALDDESLSSEVAESSNYVDESSSNKIDESSTNEIEKSSSDIIDESSSSIVDESTSNIVVESTSNEITYSSTALDDESLSSEVAESSNYVDESSSNKIDESSTNEIEKSSSDIIDESSSSIVDESTSNIVVESTSNEITYSSTALDDESLSSEVAESSNYVDESSSNKIDESSSNVASESSSNIIDDLSSNMIDKSSSLITESSANVVDQSSSNVDDISSVDIEESSTSEISEVPSEPKCKVYEDGSVTYLHDCKYSLNSNGNKIVYIYVLSSNFTGEQEENSGGAINLINCGIHCNKTCFIDCVAKSGGGGAMHIKNTINNENNATFIDLLFLRCVADYGGAVYHYSDSDLFDVTFERCHFEKNKALLTKPSSNGGNNYFFGGSALFLTCKNSLVLNCTFVRNLNSGAIKIYNKFENNYKSIGLENNENKISILGCNFEQDKTSKSSIFYSDKKNGNSIEVVDCDFKGKLKKGSHYIDGEINVKEKLHVSSCKFENDMNDAVSYNLIENDELMKKIDSTTILNNSFVVVCAAIIISLMLIFMIINLGLLHDKCKENNKSLEMQDQFYKDLNENTSNENEGILL